MHRTWPVFALLASGLLASPRASAATNVTAKVRPRVDVAFVLDTTGSMGGLIDGARRRIWSIAERIGDGQPRPLLRIGLVGYRDHGDAYITQVHDFTSDMDEVYRRLMAFQAEGGGDTPEHVSKALHDGVHLLSWSQGAALKVLFLVGDAPPHVDYQDGFHYRRHAEEASSRGIVVESIACGDDAQTARVWQEIAALGYGHFARIDAQGGMPVRVTPVDAELARLNSALSDTVVAGGNRVDQARTRERIESRKAMEAPAAVAAASYFAKAERLASNDLVDMKEVDQRTELKKLKKQPAAAPEPLRDKTEEQAIAYLAQQQQRRAQLQARILELQKEREACLRRSSPAAADGFDEQVMKSLRGRAAAAGIRY